MELIEFTFVVSPEGTNFIKEHCAFCYQNVSYDDSKNTITVRLPKPDRSSVGQLMTCIKDQGLLIGKASGRFIVLGSEHIVQYPYELETF